MSSAPCQAIELHKKEHNWRERESSLDASGGLPYTARVTCKEKTLPKPPVLLSGGSASWGPLASPLPGVSLNAPNVGH